MSSQDKALNLQAAPATSAAVEKCVNCQFYDRKNAKPADGKGPLWGQCRRHAPHLNPVTAKAYVVEGVWPMVRDDDWCGEWKVLTRDLEDSIPEADSATAPKAPQPAAPARVRLAPAPAPAAVASGDD